MNMQNLINAATGEDSDEYVLFLDRWGTSAALDKYKASGSMLDRAEIAHLQSHFVSTLGRLSIQFPNVCTTQASDCSFSFCESFDDLISFASSAFKSMTWRGDSFHLFPLRGGIGKGLVRVLDGGTLSSIQNYTYTPEIGIGMVEAATLEKTGEKGMRLFASAALGSEMPSRFSQSFKISKDRNGKDVIEINWTHPDSNNTSYLTQSIKGTTARQFIENSGKAWMSGDQYQQEVGRSLLDLLTW